MSSPIDPSSLSNIDPSYYDPTNPASPYYDPSLDLNSTDSDAAGAADSQPTVNTVKPADPTATADEVDKARRRSMRHMKNSVDQL